MSNKDKIARPAAWAATNEDGDVGALGMNESHRFDTPLYTARKPLTDDELDLMCEKALFCRISFQQFARSIEAAHGITEQQGGR